MARSKRSTERDPNVLAEPYPAPPTREPRYGFTIRWEGKYCFHCYYSLYAAKKEIEAYIDGQPFKWKSKRSIITDTGLFIQSEQDSGLEELMEYEYTALEQAWQVPSNRYDYIRRFIAVSGTYEPRQPVNATPAATPRKERTPRATPTGDVVTVAEIAGSLGIDARQARAALRKLKWEKGEGGWQWSKERTAEITAAIKSALEG